MSDIPVLFLKITESFPCSSDLNPSQQSSSSGDLDPEMMESETPPPTVPSCEADDPEVSSWRVSPDPAGLEGSRMLSRQYATLSKRNSKVPPRIDPHIEELLQGGYHYVNIT